MWSVDPNTYSNAGADGTERKIMETKMICTINGKTYDTETSTKIYGFINAFDEQDDRFAKLTIYKDKYGEYFLLGEGNARTKYRGGCAFYPYGYAFTFEKDFKRIVEEYLSDELLDESEDE